MCRSIKTLFSIEPPVTDEEIQAESLHFVRKLSGFTKPSKTNEAALQLAVDRTADVARTLIAIAETHEPRFAPFLRLALGTGMRLGELRGLHWSDVNLEAAELRVRRSVSDTGEAGPTKNKMGRTVQLSPGLVVMLSELLEERRREQIKNKWTSIPEMVFCTTSGTYHLNVDRPWNRVRRRAQNEGVRPLKFHATRHTFASHALAAGAPVPWVAAQGGWQDASTLLRSA